MTKAGCAVSAGPVSTNGQRWLSVTNCPMIGSSRLNSELAWSCCAAHDAGVPARWVTAVGVYSQQRRFRPACHDLGYGYVLAVPTKPTRHGRRHGRESRADQDRRPVGTGLPGPATSNGERSQASPAGLRWAGHAQRDSDGDRAGRDRGTRDRERLFEPVILPKHKRQRRLNSVDETVLLLTAGADDG